MSFFDDYEKSEMNRHAAEPKIQPTSIENVVKVFKNVEQNFYEPSYKKVKTLSLAKEEEKEKGFFFRDGVLKDEDGDVSNFYAKLEKSYEIIDDRGNEVQCFDVEFMVFRNGGMRKHSIKMVWASDLKSGKVLAKVPFHVIYVDRSKFSAIWGKYVNELIEEFDGEEVILYAKAGWKELNGKWIYVDGQKAIGIPDSNCKALTNRVINSSIDSKSHYNFFAEMLQVVKDMPKMAVLLLYVFASFIYKILAEVGFPLKFSLVLVGPRGCRKTSLGLCFSQLENKTSPKLNFNATKAGIQSCFKDYTDAVILIDDLAPSINPVRKRENEEKLETIIRLFGDASERKVCTEYIQEGKRKPDYSVAGGCILTGEYYYSTGVESSIARTVVIELEKDDVQLEKLSFFQNNPEILESMLHDFLLYVSNRFQYVSSTIKEEIGVCRQQYQGTFINGRFADYLGQFFAISEIIGGFLSEVSNVDTTALVEQLKESALEMLRRNDVKMKQRTPINFVARALFDFAESEKCVEWGNPVNYDDLYMIKTEPFYYVRESDLPGIVNVYGKKHAEPHIFMSSQELAKLLENEEVVTKTKEGDAWRYGKKYAQYNRVRMMKLDVEALKKAL